MAKFELDLSIRDKRTLIVLLNCFRKEYKDSLRAAERGEVAFESEEQGKKLVKRTERAVEVLNDVLNQLHDQDPR